MSSAFTLQDSLSLSDLRTFVARAGRVEDGSVRLIATNGVLAVYAAVLYPSGLLDESPTVLGLRTFAIVDDADSAPTVFDAVVPVGSLLGRLERLEGEVRDAAAPVTVTLPMQVHTVTWAAISPPRGGWTPLAPLPSDVLDASARAGIEEIATAIPTGTGEQIVHRVRSEVWARPIAGHQHVPAGAAFAAFGLGFLATPAPNAAPDAEPETVRVYETGPWTRLSTKRGHVLVKRRAWSLAQ
ncbi:hypothetical protein EYE40_06775 [Glaciihabitans arcticus]|uniref:Uncharacterized protein n=1 Tax=Glaciihabitans arcticus TaxID=2668039 RepID=A0A4V2JEW1_9MICO|nr:hypothetical protein [Glaciihabitans arcticus]TBN57129.1 hypothetical protein EYE40_06775 [Glaciihabitans arcticus]